MDNRDIQLAVPDWRDRVEGLDLQGKSGEALSFLQEMAFLHPENSEIAFCIAERHRTEGRLEDAAITFSLLSSFDDTHVKFRSLLAHADCLKLLRRYELSETKIREAIATDPGSHWPIVALADLLLASGRDYEWQSVIESSYAQLREDGKAELARYMVGIRAFRHFENTRGSINWQPRKTGKVESLTQAGLIMMVKDESDIITQNLNHHYDLGFRFFCLLNNMSTDTTDEKIRSFIEGHNDAIVLYIYDPIVGYYQSAKMAIFSDSLVQYVKTIGVDLKWMFFIDADEFLTYCGSNADKGVSDFDDLILNDESRIITMHWINAASMDVVEEFPEGYDPFVVFKKLDRKLLPVVPKVALSIKSKLYPMMGNHFVENLSEPLNSVRSTAEIDWYIVHFQLRSLKHVKTKVINGGKAFKNSQGLEIHGDHWKERSNLYEKHGDSIIVQILQNYINSIK